MPKNGIRQCQKALVSRQVAAIYKASINVNCVRPLQGETLLRPSLGRTEGRGLDVAIVGVAGTGGVDLKHALHPLVCPLAGSLREENNST